MEWEDISLSLGPRRAQDTCCPRRECVQSLIAGILQLCYGWRTSYLGTGSSCPRLLVNRDKNPFVLLLNKVCQLLSLLLRDQKVFQWRNTIRIPKCITVEIVYQNNLTAFEQQSYNSRSCVWLLGENPGKFQSSVNHHVNIDTEYQQGKKLFSIITDINQ